MSRFRSILFHERKPTGHLVEDCDYLGHQKMTKRKTIQFKIACTSAAANQTKDLFT